MGRNQELAVANDHRRFPKAEKRREICKALSFASLADPWAVESRTTMRRAAVPNSALCGRMRARAKQRSFRVFSVEFGGTLD